MKREEFTLFLSSLVFDSFQNNKSYRCKAMLKRQGRYKIKENAPQSRKKVISKYFTR